MANLNPIATTLIRQLGSALPMLGARNLVATERGLQFSIRGCRAGNKLVVSLRWDDTYDVELWRIRGVDAAMVADVEMVYADALHRTIKSLTGLDTRL